MPSYTLGLGAQIPQNDHKALWDREEQIAETKPGDLFIPKCPVVPSPHAQHLFFYSKMKRGKQGSESSSPGLLGANATRLESP